MAEPSSFSNKGVSGMEVGSLFEITGPGGVGREYMAKRQAQKTHLLGALGRREHVEFGD